MPLKPSTALLSQTRDDIEAIDRELFQLVARRMEVAAKIGEIKRQLGMPVNDPVREAELKARIKQVVAGDLESRHVDQLLEALMVMSKEYQYTDDR
ncbi:chorismate mutase [Candidatus Neomarinimicrobiota bacterium]